MTRKYGIIYGGGRGSQLACAWLMTRLHAERRRHPLPRPYDLDNPYADAQTIEIEAVCCDGAGSSWEVWHTHRMFREGHRAVPCGDFNDYEPWTFLGDIDL